MASISHLSNTGQVQVDGRTFLIKQMHLEKSPTDTVNIYMIRTEDTLPGPPGPSPNVLNGVFSPGPGDIIIGYYVNNFTPHTCFVFTGSIWVDALKEYTVHPTNDKYHFEAGTSGHIKWKLTKRPENEFQPTIPDPCDIGPQILTPQKPKRPQAAQTNDETNSQSRILRPRKRSGGWGLDDSPLKRQKFGDTSDDESMVHYEAVYTSNSEDSDYDPSGDEEEEVDEDGTRRRRKKPRRSESSISGSKLNGHGEREVIMQGERPINEIQVYSTKQAIPTSESTSTKPHTRGQGPLPSVTIVTSVQTIEESRAEKDRRKQKKSYAKLREAIKVKTAQISKPASSPTSGGSGVNEGSSVTKSKWRSSRPSAGEPASNNGKPSVDMVSDTEPIQSLPRSSPGLEYSITCSRKPAQAASPSTFTISGNTPGGSVERTPSTLPTIVAIPVKSLANGSSSLSESQSQSTSGNATSDVKTQAQISFPSNSGLLQACARRISYPFKEGPAIQRLMDSVQSVTETPKAMTVSRSDEYRDAALSVSSMNSSSSEIPKLTVDDQDNADVEAQLLPVGNAVSAAIAQSVSAKPASSNPNNKAILSSAAAGGITMTKSVSKAQKGTGTAISNAPPKASTSSAMSVRDKGTGTSLPYQGTEESNGANGHTSTLSYQTITCMDEYKDVSIEELRVHDYQNGRKKASCPGSSSADIFSSTGNKEKSFSIPNANASDGTSSRDTIIRPGVTAGRRQPVFGKRHPFMNRTGQMPGSPGMAVKKSLPSVELPSMSTSSTVIASASVATLRGPEIAVMRQPISIEQNSVSNRKVEVSGSPTGGKPSLPAESPRSASTVVVSPLGTNSGLPTPLPSPLSAPRQVPSGLGSPPNEPLQTGPVPDTSVNQSCLSASAVNPPTTSFSVGNPPGAVSPSLAVNPSAVNPPAVNPAVNQAVINPPSVQNPSSSSSPASHLSGISLAEMPSSMDDDMDGADPKEITASSSSNMEVEALEIDSSMELLEAEREAKAVLERFFSLKTKQLVSTAARLEEEKKRREVSDKFLKETQERLSNASEQNTQLEEQLKATQSQLSESQKANEDLKRKLESASQRERTALEHQKEREQEVKVLKSKLESEEAAGKKADESRIKAENLAVQAIQERELAIKEKEKKKKTRKAHQQIAVNKIKTLQNNSKILEEAIKKNEEDMKFMADIRKQASMAAANMVDPDGPEVSAAIKAVFSNQQLVSGMLGLYWANRTGR
ncbi:hypothetical protein M422DRAFT_777707 [Sphaerobolus stellatus SS14]|nr:hypothetical protein M422DRAFT_777707 [Sphaerobolus stellatus SS14]